MSNCETCGRETKRITDTIGGRHLIDEEKTAVWVYFTDVESWGIVYGRQVHSCGK